MKAYQRILSLLLCGLLLMASCGTADTKNPAADTIGGENDATAESETAPAETELSDDLPEKDLGGWDMDIVCHEDALSGTWTFTAEELNGELINDEIYNRTARLEDRFNFNYNVVPPEGSDVWGRMGTVLTNLVAAGDDVYDLAIYYTYQLQAQMVQGKLFYNMLKSPYIDFDKPWWHTEINDTFTLYGYLPAILSDYSLNSYQYANLLVYNTAMADDRGIDGLYDMVRDGTWTMDSFQKIVESVTTDTNGDGRYDENDTYGYATNFGYHALTWCYAIGEMGIHLKEDGVELGVMYLDCGMLIYDVKAQDVHAGGSGCGCSASVLAAHILPSMRKGIWNRVLFAATGALMSATSAQQGDSIPGICHAVAIENPV